MKYPNLRPVNNFRNLRSRIDSVLKGTHKPNSGNKQMSLVFVENKTDITTPRQNICEFLDLITYMVPDGEVYLFGGILRDIALFGKRGFDSDVDVVVDGSWETCVNYLESLGAIRNKFGGYRLTVGQWPVDIWGAKKTWAIEQKLVKYEGMSSLTKTTVLNWDAILMNWKTKNFICSNNYLQELSDRRLNIVLQQNPNPLGMFVRVLRHLCLKETKSISTSAIKYLIQSTKKYCINEVLESEYKSYKNNLIMPLMYEFFSGMDDLPTLDIKLKHDFVTDMLYKELDFQDYKSQHH